MKTIIVIGAILVFLISGCGMTASRSAKYSEVLQSWAGADINELTDSWGYASYSFVAPNGNTVYVYQSHAIITNEYGAELWTSWCRTFFEVNSAGRIVKWRWEGNDCK
jgi:hypothetical protein